MDKQIISSFKETPKKRISWWTMGLGLASVLIGPLLGLYASVIRPLLSGLIDENRSGAFGLNLGLFSLVISVTAVILGIIALRKGERSWAVWLGFIPALISLVFWLVMIIGELIFPH